MSVTARNRPSVEDIEAMTKMLEYLEQELGRYHPQAAELAQVTRISVQREQQDHLMAMFNLPIH